MKNTKKTAPKTEAKAEVKEKLKLPVGEYQVGAVKLKMAPMKIRQIKEFIKLLGDLDVEGKNDLTFNKLINLAFDDKLPQIARIIFGEAAAKINWDEVDYEVLEAMVADFLLLNPSLIARLKELAASFSLKA